MNFHLGISYPLIFVNVSVLSQACHYAPLSFEKYWENTFEKIPLYLKKTNYTATEKPPWG